MSSLLGFILLAAIIKVKFDIHDIHINSRPISR